MENALRVEVRVNETAQGTIVLILVLMEDALREQVGCLQTQHCRVLILVLMEDALRECEKECDKS